MYCIVFVFICIKEPTARIKCPLLWSALFVHISPVIHSRAYFDGMVRTIDVITFVDTISIAAKRLLTINVETKKICQKNEHFCGMNKLGYGFFLHRLIWKQKEVLSVQYFWKNCFSTLDFQLLNTENRSRLNSKRNIANISWCTQKRASMIHGIPSSQHLHIIFPI